MKHADLIERLEKLTGPATSPQVEDCIRHSPWYMTHESGDPIWGLFVRALQGSLDAAVALTERLLPGWGFYLRSDKEGNGCGLVYPDAFRVTPCHCNGATPAIAMVLALLRALQESDPAAKDEA